MFRFRKLLYEEKKLSAWDIDTEGTLFYALFEHLLTVEGFRTQDSMTETTITRMFNDASFLCTLILYGYKRPYLNIGEFRKYLDEESIKVCGRTDKSYRYSVVTLIVTYFLLKHTKGCEENQNIRRTITEIDTTLRENSTYSNETFEGFFYAMNLMRQQLPMEYHQRRAVTQELLDATNWNAMTNGYNVQMIQNIVNVIGRNDAEKLLLINSMEAEITSAYNNDIDVCLPF